MRNKPIVCIDPGHGGYDSGAVRASHYEKEDNLRMTKAIEKELIALGCTVILTRNTDCFLSLAERVKTAKKNQAEVFLSIHRNAFTTSDANGTEVWIAQKDNRSSKALAEKLLMELSQVGIQRNRGIKTGDFYVLRNATSPACLLELGFLSNQKDNELFELHFDAYAKAIAKAIVSFCGKEEPQKETAKAYYFVQAGAFEKKENALSLQKELIQKGYNTIIKQTQ